MVCFFFKFLVGLLSLKEGLLTNVTFGIGWFVVWEY